MEINRVHFFHYCLSFLLNNLLLQNRNCFSLIFFNLIMFCMGNQTIFFKIWKLMLIVRKMKWNDRISLENLESQELNVLKKAIHWWLCNEFHYIHFKDSVFLSFLMAKYLSYLKRLDFLKIYSFKDADDDHDGWWNEKKNIFWTSITKIKTKC